MKNNVDMILHGSIFKMVCNLSFPNFIGVSSMPLVIIADAYFISQLGNIPLASLALVFPFISLMQMMSAGAIGGGTTSSVSRYLGSGSISKANSAVWHAIIIGIILSLIYTIIFCVFPKDVFQLMGGNDLVLQGAIAYSQIAFGGSIFIWLLFILSAMLRAVGDVVTPARVQVIGCIFQIFLAGTLTLGWFDFPSLGIIGPAIAMVVSHFVMTLYLYFYIKFKQSIITIFPHQINIISILDIMKVGGGGLINSITIAGTVAVVTAAVSYHGIEVLAGYGLASRLEIIITPLVFGIGSVLTASVGINVGANQLIRAKKIAWTGASISFFIIGILGFVVTFYPEVWLNNFKTNFLIEEGAILYLVIVAPFYCFFAGGQTLYFASQGRGKVFFPVIVGILRFLSVSIICYFAINLDWSLNTIFYGVSFGLIITGLGLSLCMFSSDWKIID
ncbi:MATE family efflux transporter [Alphaproteobacteria bacterium]|nr:MATE family efflux transporter [Alphaproteobacteria bacterium]